MGLLAAEMVACSGKDTGDIFTDVYGDFGFCPSAMMAAWDWRWRRRGHGEKISRPPRCNRARKASIDFSLTKPASLPGALHNHFNQERHLITREVYKQTRSAALAEWRAIVA